MSNANTLYQQYEYSDFLILFFNIIYYIKLVISIKSIANQSGRVGFNILMLSTNLTLLCMRHTIYCFYNFVVSLIIHVKLKNTKWIWVITITLKKFTNMKLKKISF